MLNSRKCTGAASTPSSAQRARVLLSASLASWVREGPAGPAMVVVEWKAMPRNLNSVTVGTGWPANRSPAASASCRGAVHAPLISGMTLVLAVLTVNPSCRL